MGTDDQSGTRRRIAKAAGTAGVVTALAGCGGQTDETPSNDDTAEESGISFTLNGDSFSVDSDPETPLLYVLRNEAGLNGPKFGCGLQQCGACTVESDGETVRSCGIPVESVDGSDVVTTSGLGSEDDTHPLQETFIDEQAAQCGFCVSGMIMEAKTLLEENSDPSEAEIRSHLDGNLCRCGTHSRIVSAVSRAADEME